MTPDLTPFGIDTATWTVYAALTVTSLLAILCAVCSLMEGRALPGRTERKETVARRTAA